jgi:hypothetical protein
MSKAVLSEQVFRFVWGKNQIKIATIVFYKYDDGWAFSKCDYNIAKRYDLDDWCFLKDLATEILRLNEEVAKV